MKKIFSLMIAIMFTSSLFAQSIVLVSYEDQTPYQNGDIITVNSDYGVTLLLGKLGVHNNSTDTLDIYVKRIVISTVENSANSFCWGACFDTSINISPVSVLINAGETDLYGFMAEYFNQNTSLPIPYGTSTICYSFFDPRNVNDSAWIYINFTVGNESVEELNQISGKVYPNPASDFIYVESNASQNSEIAIYNITGQLVKTVPVTSEKTQINISELQNGIYFYSIITNGIKVDSKRFVVSK